MSPVDLGLTQRMYMYMGRPRLIGSALDLHGHAGITDWSGEAIDMLLSASTAWGFSANSTRNTIYCNVLSAAV